MDLFPCLVLLAPVWARFAPFGPVLPCLVKFEFKDIDAKYLRVYKHNVLRRIQIDFEILLLKDLLALLKMLRLYNFA